MSTPRTVVHKHQTTSRRELDENDLIRHMASSILLQAVEDWAGCIGMEAMLNNGEAGKRVEYFRQRRTRAEPTGRRTHRRLVRTALVP